jgi:S1-C subfamily serine protease
VAAVGSTETTPAGRAKMQPGDRILRADGQSLSSASELHALATRVPAPRSIGLELMRAGKPAKVKLKLGK